MNCEVAKLEKLRNRMKKKERKRGNQVGLHYQVVVSNPTIPPLPTITDERKKGKKKKKKN
jgi:hypothetical protein